MVKVSRGSGGASNGGDVAGNIWREVVTLADHCIGDTTATQCQTGHIVLQTAMI